MKEVLLRQELRRRRISGLFKAADKLSNLSAITLTDVEVEAEIQAARKSRGLRHTSDKQPKKRAKGDSTGQPR